MLARTACPNLSEEMEEMGAKGCARIKADSMGIGRPYQNSTRPYCPNTELIFNPFHLTGLTRHHPAHPIFLAAAKKTISLPLTIAFTPTH